MANESQARKAPEREISVDLSEGDPKKAIERRAPKSDISAHVRDDDDRGNARGAPKRSKTEQQLFDRMTRMQRSMTRQFNQKFADQQAEHQREIAALRQRQDSGVEIERGSAQLKDAHEKLMAELEAKLAEANEKGDSAGIGKITAQMIRADGEYHAKLTGTQVRKDVTGDDPNKGGQQRQQQQTAKGPTAAGSRFILANEDWWEDPEFAIEKAAASTVFLDLVQNEGFSDNDDETFKEVAKRLKAKFPDLPVASKKGKLVRAADEGDRGEDADRGPGDGDDDDEEVRDRDRDDEGNQRERQRPASVRIADRGSGGGREARGNRRTLTSEEMATMRKVGLNPDSDKDVMSFMKEAVAMEQASR